MASLPQDSSCVDPSGQTVAYSRKSKSLSILCTNFMSLYNRDDVDAIGLDDAAKRLGVERRRIYDIVNVLESVGVLARKGKNQYNWIGYQGIPKALQNLKDEPINEYVHHTQNPYIKSSQEEEEESGNQSTDLEADKSSMFTDTSASLNAACKAKSALDQRREKSLGLLTQNFVRLFLTTDNYPITLDEAAKVLLGEGHDSVNMRTKVRRLYDIANVLQAMSLIEKTTQTDSKKPGYRWLGPEGKPKTELTGLSIEIPKPSRKRTFGTEVTNLEPSKRPNLGSFKESRPVKLGQLAECNMPAQQVRSSEKGGFVFGPFQPIGMKRENSSNSNVQSVDREKVKQWESMANAFRPQYHNQALSDLFGHYVEAWRSWYKQFAQGSNGMSF
ncbi:hypothetical protein LUZ60_000039 [Juncus effusus]|nr:hypothetical protein LUZ60_000039 [Juncus effusus]